MNRTLLKGCGIGCGVIALLFMVLIGGGAWFAREMGREYKVVQATETALCEAHGGLEGWAPPAGLVPAAERVAVFAAVRTRTGEWRAQLEDGIARFTADRAKGGGPAGLWRAIRSGSDLGMLYAGFWSARNRILLDEGMGPAEYAWTYGLVYYAWLGKDPAAGAGELDVRAGGGLEVRVEVGDHDPRVQARERMHELLTPLFAAAVPGAVTAAELAAERASLDLDPRRVPWQDGLPDPLAAAFAPHRAALEAAWSDAVNPLELMFNLQEWSREQQEAKDRAEG